MTAIGTNTYYLPHIFSYLLGGGFVDPATGETIYSGKQNLSIVSKGFYKALAQAEMQQHVREPSKKVLDIFTDYLARCGEGATDIFIDPRPLTEETHITRAVRKILMDVLPSIESFNTDLSKPFIPCRKQIQCIQILARTLGNPASPEESVDVVRVSSWICAEDMGTAEALAESITNEQDKDTALMSIVDAWIYRDNLDRAKAETNNIKDVSHRSNTLARVCSALISHNRLEDAEVLSALIPQRADQDGVNSQLSFAWVAKNNPAKARKVASRISLEDDRKDALSHITEVFPVSGGGTSSSTQSALSSQSSSACAIQ